MNNMKALREAAIMSQAAVAKALNTTQQTYQRWESGKSEPSIDALQGMAILFKVPISKILGTPDGSGLGFEPNHYILTDDDSGFWGHLGIQLPRNENSLWFPVSGQEQNRLTQYLNNDYEPGGIVHASTLDNRLLILSVDTLNRIRFLEDACEEPADDKGWFENSRMLDDGVSGLPTILYQAMTALITNDEAKMDNLGEAVMEKAIALLPDQDTNRQQIARTLIETRIHLIDGTTVRTSPDDESLIDLVNDFNQDSLSWLIRIQDHNECRDLIPADRVSLIDIPLCVYREAMASLFPDELSEEA